VSGNGKCVKAGKLSCVVSEWFHKVQVRSCLVALAGEVGA
jgi:hypothetical protein